MKILIITSCTGEKIFNPENKLLKIDFCNKSILKHREIELIKYKTKATDMYTGMQHLRLMEGVDIFRDCFGEESINVCIVSAGYGIIKETQKIFPYEVTFNNMNNKEILEWSNELNIKNDLANIIKGYDLVFFLLGEKYLRSLNLPVKNVCEQQKLIFFASKTSKKLIPNKKPYYFLEVGQEDAKSFSYGLIGLKGYLMKLLLSEVTLNGYKLIESIFCNPSIIKEILHKYKVEQGEIYEI